MNLAESLLLMNMPEDNPAESIEFEGLTFERQRNPQPIGTLWFVIHPKLYAIACFVTEIPKGQPTMSIHCEVDDDYQRSGYGTIIYKFANHLAEREGRTLVPSSLQSKASEAFWANKGHQFQQSSASKIFDKGCEGIIDLNKVFNRPGNAFFVEGETITEAGEAGYLYHWMGISKAEEVFDHDLMPAKWEHLIGGRRVRGSSFSRNKMFRFGEERCIRLTVDKRLLSQTNRIIPLDAEVVYNRAKSANAAILFGKEHKPKPDTVFDRVEHGPKGSAFAEEFVIGDIRNLSRCIVKIDVHNFNSGHWGFFVENSLKQYCNTHDLDWELSEDAKERMRRFKEPD